MNFALEELLSLPQVVHQKKGPVMCFECGTWKRFRENKFSYFVLISDACSLHARLACADNTPADIYCVDCKADLCQPCRTKTHASKLLASHQMVDQARKPAVAPLPQCEKHRARHLDLFCIDCNVRQLGRIYVDVSALLTLV